MAALSDRGEGDVVVLDREFFVALDGAESGVEVVVAFVGVALHFDRLGKFLGGGDDALQGDGGIGVVTLLQLGFGEEECLFDESDFLQQTLVVNGEIARGADCLRSLLVGQLRSAPALKSQLLLFLRRQHGAVGGHLLQVAPREAEDCNGHEHGNSGDGRKEFRAIGTAGRAIAL